MSPQVGRERGLGRAGTDAYRAVSLSARALAIGITRKQADRHGYGKAFNMPAWPVGDRADHWDAQVLPSMGVGDFVIDDSLVLVFVR